MRFVIAADYDELSHRGADEVEAVISTNPTAAVLVATGDTPMGLYQELARRRGEGALDASGLRVFQLDEYLDLEPDDRRSLFGWTQRSFIGPLGISPENVGRLAAEMENLEAACRAYDAAVEAVGGIDLAILGLGPNGHLGFNEPPAAADAPTRVVDLAAESIESNARYWGGRDAVPRRAMTAGMNVILGARRIVLVVSGAHKRDVLARTVGGAVTSRVPASYLQAATDVTVLADEDAWGAMPEPKQAHPS